MFKGHTPEGWKAAAQLYRHSVTADSYGYESFHYGDKPDCTLHACWQIEQSQAVQEESGLKVKEIISGRLFLKDIGSFRVQPGDRLAIDEALYQVTAAPVSLSFQSVTAERVQP